MSDETIGFKVEVYDRDLTDTERRDLQTAVSHVLAGDFVAVFSGIDELDAERRETLQEIAKEARNVEQGTVLGVPDE